MYPSKNLTGMLLKEGKLDYEHTLWSFSVFELS